VRLQKSETKFNFDTKETFAESIVNQAYLEVFGTFGKVKTCFTGKAGKPEPTTKPLTASGQF